MKIGLMPDGGSTFFLPRAVGHAKAFELMATGISSTLTTPLPWLVNRVGRSEELDTTVNGMASRLAAAAPIALRKIKEGLNQAQRGSRFCAGL